MNKNIQIAFLLASSLLYNPVFAGQSTSTLGGAAELNPTCTVAVGNLNFGLITPQLTGQTTALTTITSVCTKETSYTLSLNLGNGATYTNRIMVGNTKNDLLHYNIYNDTTYTSVVGDGTSNTVNFSAVGSGANQNFNLYGALPLNQYIIPDNYTDSLTVTLNY